MTRITKKLEISTCLTYEITECWLITANTIYTTPSVQCPLLSALHLTALCSLFIGSDELSKWPGIALPENSRVEIWTWIWPAAGAWEDGYSYKAARNQERGQARGHCKGCQIGGEQFPSVPSEGRDSNGLSSTSNFNISILQTGLGWASCYYPPASTQHFLGVGCFEPSMSASILSPRCLSIV